MDWEKIGIVATTGLFVWFMFARMGKGGFKRMLESSRDAPQYWGTYVFLMVIVIGFVYFLIKL